MQLPVILKSKLMVPKLGKEVLTRDFVGELAEGIVSHPLSLVIANAGFGKTTLAAQAVNTLNMPLAWYSPGPEDDSAYIFISYLATALNQLAPGLVDWYISGIAQQKFVWQRAFEVLLSGMESLPIREGILVIDDWQLLGRNRDIADFMDRFIACKGEELHLLLLSREPVKLPIINRLHAQGQLLEVNSRELAFSREELNTLLQAHAGDGQLLSLSKEIYSYTEGWIMAIRMILNAKNPSPLIPHSSFGNLFEYLSYNILGQLDDETRRFLVSSSIPEFFGYQLCQEVLGYSPEFVDSVIRQGMFTSEVNVDLYRFHPLFREFLNRQAVKDSISYKAVNQRLAQFYLRRNEMENALGCFIKAESWPEASQTLNALARELVFSDRVGLMKELLGQLPVQYREHPSIHLALGDEARFSFQYEKAIALYRKAEEGFASVKEALGIASALRSIGEVYLETLEPKAGDVLHQAYRMLGKEPSLEKAAILELLAEDKVNQGKPAQARRYRALAEQNQIQEIDKHNLRARLLIRTGRILEAIEALAQPKAVEQGGTKVHSVFRETHMLLATCFSFIGQAEKAIQMARETIAIGIRTGISSVEGMGHIRLGHALLLGESANLKEAMQAYNTARQLLRDSDAQRAHSELNMGLCLLYALQGSWEQAEKAGQEGLAISRGSQDDWFSAVLLHVQGMAAALCGKQDRAGIFLRDAQSAFEACGDSFGRCAGLWWQSRLARDEGRHAEFSRLYARFLDILKADGYQFLVEEATLFGDIKGDVRAVIHQAFLQRSVKGADAPGQPLVEAVTSHGIRIHTLDNFRFIRDGAEVPLNAWRRKNALRLLTLFLVKRKSLLNKEEILAYLWPEDEQDFAERNLKSAFYSLNKVLEPERKPWGGAHFIKRRGSTYYLNLAADLWLDSEEFAANVESARKIWRTEPDRAASLLGRAFELYRGDYLAGISMDEWCLEEKDRLVLLYIEAAEMMASIEKTRLNTNSVIRYAEMILAKDKFWEKAYQFKIWSYKQEGNLVMATRVFNQCLQTFNEEMGVNPSPETVKLLKQPL